MIFGSKRDFGLITGINRELLSNVIEQEVLYYKISLEQTPANLYGESTQKVFWEPVKINCLIDRGDQQTVSDDFGPDSIRDVKFRFLKQDLEDVRTFPEVGDIIVWDEDYYEVDNTTENQLLLGKDPDYALTTYGPDYGGSLSIICICHLTRASKVGIISRDFPSPIDPSSIAATSMEKHSGILPNGNTGGNLVQVGNGMTNNPLNYTFPMYLMLIEGPNYTTCHIQNVSYPVKVGKITNIITNLGQSGTPNEFQGNTIVNSGVTASNAAEFVTVWNTLNSVSGSISGSQIVQVPGGTATSFTLTPVNVNLRPQAAWCYSI